MPVASLRYRSAPIGKQTELHAIIPDGPGPFPVVYQLHGLSDDASAWLRWTSIERYATARGLMVVLLDGDRWFYTNLDLPGMAWMDHILHGIETAERVFPAARSAARRGIGGLSMGGYGAMKIALRHPDRFASVATHSGAYDVAGFRARHPGLATLLPRVPAADDVYRLAAKAGPKPAIRFDCGTEDFLIEDSRRLHRILDRAGVPHVYEEHPGTHEWAYWDRHVQAALDFHGAAFAPKRRTAKRG